MRKRRGNLMVVVVFATVMAIISFGVLSVATSLYVQNEETATRYAHAQSYRSAIEIAAYQYCTDLQTVVETRSLSGEWLTITGSAIVTEALEEVQRAIADPSNDMLWKVQDISQAVSGVSLTNPDIVLNLLSLLSEGTTQFSLTLEDYPAINYSSSESYIYGDEGLFKLLPLELHIHLQAKGEVYDDVLYVDGLYLRMVRESIIGAGDYRDTRFTMTVVQGERGLQIYRV